MLCISIISIMKCVLERRLFYPKVELTDTHCHVCQFIISCSFFKSERALISEYSYPLF